MYVEDGLSIPMVAHMNRDAGSNALKTEVLNEHWTLEIEPVKTISLPTVLSRIGGHIDYMKVDCETSEYYLLLSQNLDRIDYIAIELHWQMGKEKYDALVEHLLKTHTVIGTYQWQEEHNREVLFKKVK